MKRLQKYIILSILPVSLLFTGCSHAQKTDFAYIQQLLSNSSADSAIHSLHQIDTLSLSTTHKGAYYYYLGNAYFIADQHQTAYKNLIKSLKVYTSLQNQKKIAEINFKIGLLLNHQKNLNISSKDYFDKYLKYAKSKNDPKKLDSAYTSIAVNYLHNDNGDVALHYFNKAISEAKKSNDSLRIASIQFNKAVTYKEVLKKLDSALVTYQSVLPTFIRYNKKEYISYTYNNIAEVYKSKKNYLKAIAYYQKADSVPIKEFKPKTKSFYYKNISETYHQIENHEQAYLYLHKLTILKDSINDVQQNIEISKIKEEYDNEKLRADHLKTEAKRVQNRNLLVGSLLLLVFGAITTFLLLKNTKRKQRIAEQEREIEIQKTEKLLKEQELTAIDAMISGQEKERQRLANDLHDNLGSTLATVKLHFEHLKNHRNNSKAENIEELYIKTNNLLNEAYQKVRTIAHEKNSGVMANQGLLPAVQKLAKKVSNGNQLQIEVQAYGLEERLDNTIEISIFRIIQELITNTIKHAKASEINISLTNHDSLLNIIVEDNGCGFDIHMISQKEGMGLKSIEKRIEHMEGTFEIDTTIGKGTHIIINLPI